jgi:hypothetical protein
MARLTVPDSACDGDFGADDRLAALAGHHAADAGRGALGKHGSSSQGCHETKRQLGHPETTGMGHFNSLDSNGDRLENNA